MTIGVRLLRDGTVINTRAAFFQKAAEAIRLPLVFSYVDSGAGTKSTVYKIQVKRNVNCSAVFSERTLVVQYAYR